MCLLFKTSSTWGRHLLIPAHLNFRVQRKPLLCFTLWKNNSAFAINYVALVWKRWEQGHTQQAAASGVERKDCTMWLLWMYHSSLTVWVRAIPRGSSVPVASAFCLLSVGHGVERGLQLHLDTHRPFPANNDTADTRSPKFDHLESVSDVKGVCSTRTRWIIKIHCQLPVEILYRTWSFTVTLNWTVVHQILKPSPTGILTWVSHGNWSIYYI